MAVRIKRNKVVKATVLSSGLALDLYSRKDVEEFLKEVKSKELEVKFTIGATKEVIKVTDDKEQFGDDIDWIRVKCIRYLNGGK